MSAEKAKAHYLGKPGHHKLNCAQTIAHAFREKFNLPPETVGQLAVCGGGRSPEGVCGSLYAARIILGAKRPDVVEACEQSLLSRAGSIKCQEIRAAKKLSCVGCVEMIAEKIERA